MNEKFREIEIAPDFLKNFPDPLWDKLDLEYCRPLSAIEGWEDGYRFTILELEHRRFGPLAGNGATANTTFFIVAIPESITGRFVSWHPVDCHVSVDCSYAYLAKPGKQARPKKWHDLILATIKIVESLATRSEMADKVQAYAPTYRPVGVGAPVHAFWAIVSLAFSLLLVGVGLGIMFGLIDYRPECFSNSSAPRCKATTSVYRFGEAVHEGGTYLLGGGVLLVGVFYFRERMRKRLRSKHKLPPEY